ncbi:folylpolyglutamate synthase, mitochondrial-like [Diadema antillarum]|uniref:folylpolyglutamate synthase, mitochondrial-like n=1 Tax=Diadema antillarum TaxID=105358 RepID=UPI003A8B4CA9
MIGLSRRFRHIYTFQSVLAPSLGRCRTTFSHNTVPQPVLRSVGTVFAHQICSLTKAQDHLVKPRFLSLAKGLPLSGKHLAAEAAMRDLMHIASLGSSAAHVASASPKKPERDADAEKCTSDEPVVGSTEEVYQEAVRRLNTLQSNAKTIDEIKKNRDRGAYKNIPDVIDYASRVGISLDRLDDLSVIHVAGTKGKGSVCAFTESILRSSGFKTGFYSSPHLVEVRERIRLNGKPISKEDFAKYFFKVYNRLDATKDQYQGKMPAYFRFLTVMAFQVFLEEKVDVAIMEVGIGGEYDCTNIIRKPVVVGISSLGVDHIGVLGSTVDKIAWHKAGIIKTGRPAFTVPQPENSIQVIQDRAKEKEASLHVVPHLASYDFHGHDLTLGLAGMHQYLNATLALHLAKTWVTEKHPGKFSFEGEEEEEGPASKHRKVTETTQVSEEVLSGGDVLEATPFALPEEFIQGLKKCYWPGRNQVVRREKITYYLDGAHTPRSIAACCRWFHEKAEAEAENIKGPVARILIFNSTGDRDEYSLLPKVVTCNFSGAAFCPNIISLYSHDSVADTTNFTTTTERQMKRCNQNLVAFQTLLQQLQSKSSSPGTVSSTPTAAGDSDHHNLHTVSDNPSRVIMDHPSSTNSQSAEGIYSLDSDSASKEVHQTKVVKLPSILDALQWAACGRDPVLSSPSNHDPTPSSHAIAANHIQVLVTGSIHLVGGVIRILDPNLVSQNSSD